MKMHLLKLFLVLTFHHLICNALVTSSTIRNLTSLTDELRTRITEKTDEESVNGQNVVQLLGTEQVVLRSGHSEEDGVETEDNISAALKILCSDLLVELEKDLTESSSSSDDSFSDQTDLRCRVLIREYHHFLESTVKFLHVIQERQMFWRWSAESAIFDGVGWLQALWASRSANKQDRSFIEQQMSFYGETGCFGKDQEVLRRDVEIVEYMNDLIDSFY